MKSVYRFLLVLSGITSVATVTAQTPCDTITGYECKSIVTDTLFNPYVTGALGNWRSNRAYTYYAARTETDPAAQTNIRRDGAFADFTAYWAFQDNRLVVQPDTARWVWNSEMTLFNRKGFEIENKDPLGRYNSGLYGYNLTMPVAVIQNSRYRESAYEGFEDYDFVTRICDTACAATRHIDFSTYRDWLDTTQKHTGKHSLRINQQEQAGLSFSLVPADQDTVMSTLDFSLLQDTCSPDDFVLESVKSSNSILLPSFAPVPGKRMVLSAWVKEDQDCKCISYTNNRIVLIFTGGSGGSLVLSPTGAIIEGWQRYESYFDIPADATGITVGLEATGSVTVYFDDLRIHPFNANMKSFVFHPTNLRLMAELDENNYATLYEYDDDGTLIRLKKETQRGIKTIKETRSALLKEQ